jgi:hypothetical protein
LALFAESPLRLDVEGGQMGSGGWAVAALTFSFLIIQSCGDDLATGHITTPGASGERLPEWSYDEGAELWDGGAAVALDEWPWGGNVEMRRGEWGQRYTMTCVPEARELAVWGSNPYTDDSPVCTAGAHLGVIDRRLGGPVTIEIRPAQKRFEGSTRFGIVGLSWGPYPGSFIVVR